ncbi:MAG: DoxX family protein [Rhodothermia bacterium]|nr:DoxX family protein [Rhodothermia bacterium]
MKQIEVVILNPRIGRILFSLPFLLFGVKQLLAAPIIGGVMPKWVPFGLVFVHLAGLCQIAAAISIYTQKHTRLAMTLLSVLLGLYILVIHLPGVIAGGPEALKYLWALLKDAGLMGGAILLGAGIEAEAPVPETPSS